jgi:hypothetical protein
MTKWEYAVVALGKFAATEDALNPHGAEGWELVSVIQQPAGDFIGFMKRRLPTPTLPDGPDEG